MRSAPIGSVAAGVLLAAAGCGGGSSYGGSSSSSGSASSGGGQEVKLTADPGGKLKFDKTSLTADKSGKVSIVLDNPSDTSHGIEIEGNGAEAKGEIVGKGGKSTATADLKDGTYQVYCPVPGHKQAGMNAKLVVGSGGSGGSDSSGGGGGGGY
jgi:uncharacterized cupredoxin-like copper-binding protein